MKRSSDFWLQAPQSDPDEGNEGTRIHCQIIVVGKKQETTGHKTVSHTGTKKINCHRQVVKEIMLGQI